MEIGTEMLGFRLERCEPTRALYAQWFLGPIAIRPKIGMLFSRRYPVLGRREVLLHVDKAKGLTTKRFLKEHLAIAHKIFLAADAEAEAIDVDDAGQLYGEPADDASTFLPEDADAPPRDGAPGSPATKH